MHVGGLVAGGAARTLLGATNSSADHTGVTGDQGINTNQGHLHSTAVLSTIMAVLSLVTSLFIVYRWLRLCYSRHMHIDHNSEFATFTAIGSAVAALGFIVYRPTHTDDFNDHNIGCHLQTAFLQFGWMAIATWLAAGWHSTYIRAKHFVDFNEEGEAILDADRRARASQTKMPAYLRHNRPGEVSRAFPRVDSDLELSPTGGGAVEAQEGTGRPRRSKVLQRGVSQRTRTRLIRTEANYRLYHVICWGISLICAIPTALGAVGTKSGAWCWISHEETVYRWVFLYVPGFVALVVSIVYYVKWRRVTKEHQDTHVSDDGLAMQYILMVTLVTLLLFVIEKVAVAVKGAPILGFSDFVNIAVPCQGVLFNGPVIIAIAVVTARRDKAEAVKLLGKPDLEQQNWYDQTVVELTEKTAAVREFETTWHLDPYTSKDQKAHGSAIKTKVLICVLFLCITCYRGSLGLLEVQAHPYFSTFALNGARSLVAAFFFSVAMGLMKFLMLMGWMRYDFVPYAQLQSKFVLPNNKLFTSLMVGMTILNNQLPVNMMAIVGGILPPTIIPVFLSTIPILTLFMKLVLFSHTTHVTMSTAIGLSVSLAGAIFISFPQFASAPNTSGSGSTGGIIMGLVIPLSWAFAAMYNKIWLKPFGKYQWTKAFYVNWLGSIVSFIAAAVGAISSTEPWRFHWDGIGWIFGLGFLAFIGSVWTYTLLDLVDPVAFGTIWTMVPIVGVVWELALAKDGIPSGGLQLSGVVLVVAGIVILLQQK